jgi:hypothetical protein
MEKDYRTLKRASASRRSGEWNDDDFDVLANGAVVGRIFKVHAALLECRGCGRWHSAVSQTKFGRGGSNHRIAQLNGALATFASSKQAKIDRL